MTDLPFSSSTNVAVGARRGRGKTRVALVLAGGLALVPGGAPAEAQPEDRVGHSPSSAGAETAPERVDAQLALARVCASEIGLSGAPAECAAIHDVLSRRAGRWGSSLTWAARAYSTRVFDRGRQDPRAWIAHLRPDGRAPDGWPEVVAVRRGGQVQQVQHAPWGAYRDRWLRL
jgi:hypothetical protein